jgi:hypothetical protein
LLSIARKDNAHIDLDNRIYFSLVQDACRWIEYAAGCVLHQPTRWTSQPEHYRWRLTIWPVVLAIVWAASTPGAFSKARSLLGGEAMVKCLTDFSCWETIAKIAPIGTALIALIAAMIALRAIWAQMHVARRRASIDFFLKTEIDKTVIDLYNKFKANAPSIAFVPGPLDLARSDYEDIRAFLDICELIAVGVNEGALLIKLRSS